MTRKVALIKKIQSVLEIYNTTFTTKLELTVHKKFTIKELEYIFLNLVQATTNNIELTTVTVLIPMFVNNILSE